MEAQSRQVGHVQGVRIDARDWGAALFRILQWSQSRKSRYVAVCNAHVVVTAARDVAYGRIINGADMATPDGAPVAWLLRRQGFKGQSRISGPDLMWALCDCCAKRGIPIFLYGSTRSTLERLIVALKDAFPALRIVGSESPPFRSNEEIEPDPAASNRINQSGAGIVFVGLGCPKQERWMQVHRGHVRAVMIGVGAAFDFHAGNIRRAPVWMRNHGLEWLHRLGSEPKRLWKRYLITNTLFIGMAVRQLLGEWFGQRSARKQR